LGSNKDEKWRFVSPTQGSNFFAVMDYATMNMGIVADPSSGGKVASFMSCNESQLLWQVLKVDFGVADGEFHLLSCEILCI